MLTSISGDFQRPCSEENYTYDRFREVYRNDAGNIHYLIPVNELPLTCLEYTKIFISRIIACVVTLFQVLRTGDYAIRDTILRRNWEFVKHGKNLCVCFSFGYIPLQMEFTKDRILVNPGFIPNSYIQTVSNYSELDLGNLLFRTIPYNLVSCTRLTHLSLRGNFLRGLPYSFGRLPLENLDLSNNQFTYIPEVLYSLPRSCVINMQGNPISENFIENHQTQIRAPGYSGPRFVFSPERYHRPPNENLDLERPHINLTRAYLESIQDLTRFYLHNWNLSTLPEAIGSRNNLLLLDLSRNQFQVIPEVLYRLPRETKVLMKENPLPEDAKEAHRRRAAANGYQGPEIIFA